MATGKAFSESGTQESELLECSNTLPDAEKPAGLHYEDATDKGHI